MSVLAHFVFDDYVDGVALASRTGTMALSAETYDAADTSFPRDVRWRHFAREVKVDSDAGFDLVGNSAAANLLPGPGRVRTYSFIMVVGDGVEGDTRQVWRIEKSGDPTKYMAIYHRRDESDETTSVFFEMSNGVDTYKAQSRFEYPNDWMSVIVAVDLDNESVHIFGNSGQDERPTEGDIFDVDAVFDFDNDPIKMFTCDQAGEMRVIEFMAQDVLYDQTLASRSMAMFNAIFNRLQETTTPPG